MLTEFEVDLYKTYVKEFISQHPPKGSRVTIPVKNGSLICGILDDLEWEERLWEEGIKIDLIQLHYNGQRSAYGNFTNLEYRICSLDCLGERDTEDVPQPSYLAEPIFSLRFPGRAITISSNSIPLAKLSYINTDISIEGFRQAKIAHHIQAKISSRLGINTSVVTGRLSNSKIVI